jgi:hypothetical protein
LNGQEADVVDVEARYRLDRMGWVGIMSGEALGH